MSYISRSELYNAYKDCMKHKNKTENAILFEIDDNLKLDNLYKELNTMTYTIGRSIVFTLLKNNVAYREVFAADFKDRIVHHLLVNRINDSIEKYELINDNYACRKNKGTLYGAKRCRTQLKLCLQEMRRNNEDLDNCTIFKSDFKNFFNSLNKEKIYDALEKFIINYMSEDKNMVFNLYLAKLIIMHNPQEESNYIRKQPKRFWKNLPTNKSLFNLDKTHGIAVGNLTSLVFANFYLSIFDHYVKDVLGYKYYGRYVDDWNIITGKIDKIGEDYKKIIEFVKTLDLSINVNKTYIQNYKHGINFIGFMIYEDRVYIRNSTKKKFKNMVYLYNKEIYNKYLFYGKLPSLEYVKKIIPRWNSYIGMFQYCKARNIWKKALKNNIYFNKALSYIVEFDRFGFMRFTKQCKLLNKDNILYGKLSVIYKK